MKFNFSQNNENKLLELIIIISIKKMNYNNIILINIAR